MRAMVTRLQRSDELRRSIEPFLSFFNGPYATLSTDPETANFAVGNPQEMPLPAYVAAVRGHLEPQNKDWFAYKVSEPNARQTVARTLTARTGIEWDPDDVAMTNGGFAALAVAMHALLGPGDEAVFLCPPWFFYEMQILAAGGVPVRVRIQPPAFDLDLADIEAAITPRTRLVLLNNPHNPSGRVYPLADLQRLADVLTEASARHGSPIYLLSDEPYNRILFDGHAFHSPAEVYPRTVVSYSYGKTTLAPGMRMGYLTWSPDMPDRERLREDVFVAQFATGFAFPNADLQHAIEDIEKVSIDVPALQRRRDRMVPALRDMGYEATMPEGTFYIMARAPLDDDLRFAEMLNRHKVLVLPGSIVELPGWFRISLTASDDMVDRGLPGLAAAMAEASAI
jgi:aspartate aminotransferase